MSSIVNVTQRSWAILAYFVELYISLSLSMKWRLRKHLRICADTHQCISVNELKSCLKKTCCRQSWRGQVLEHHAKMADTKPLLNSKHNKKCTEHAATFWAWKFLVRLCIEWFKTDFSNHCRVVRSIIAITY